VQIATTSNLFFDNNDIYDDGRTFNGNFPEGNKQIANPYMFGSNQAIELNLTQPVVYKHPLMEATTQIHPNSETDNYYPNRIQNAT